MCIRDRYSGGWAGPGAQVGFASIEPLHHQVHVLSAELLELHAGGRTAQALARLTELHALRDSLLEQLKRLLQASRQ